MSHCLSVYRQLLREVNLQYTKNNSLYANELKAVYKANKDITDPVQIDTLNRNADDILTFLRSFRQHKELRARYSAIVMEQKKQMEMTAKRVGLELPETYDAAAPKPLSGSTPKKDGAKEEASVVDRIANAFSNKQ
ncbi:uncharacterized protein BYT42DRAFT_500207 [Radiomyces spectabilis]|uniref:uncharacterized protein n=1 Tax=Radiomyces spectabilis TaxID=64574 RepID=UPI00221FBFC2|nr:uncharacterized protein BYT42DRAFT_500207 [Radiomyces spectabilis]KAI8374246.1 hypothetical protein BYT42DRAFT_500207 [Radiomyces spectabilis]